jgi:hypothetical protein
MNDLDLNSNWFHVHEATNLATLAPIWVCHVLGICNLLRFCYFLRDINLTYVLSVIAKKKNICAFSFRNTFLSLDIIASSLYTMI